MIVSWKIALRRALVASALGCAGLMSSLVRAQDDDSLTIGSSAPALDVEHWVQDGSGKFKPVTEFEKGKVYVVEFWATWCGPCIASMPHLVEIQQKYADKGVQIVSISDEDLETVEKFLEREFTGSTESKEGAAAEDAPKTFRDLTSAYCLTTDPDGSSNKSYMEAAGQNGIPCAFIVGKDQKIEWIGHPMSMDEALEQVVEGNWDREAFAEQFKEEQQMDLLMSKIMRSARGGKVDAALAMIDEAVEAAKSDEVKQRLKVMRIQLLAQSGKSEEAMAALDAMIESSDDAALKQELGMFRVQMLLEDLSNPKLADGVTKAYEDYKDDPGFVNFIAWTIYESMSDGTLDNEALLKASRVVSEKAAEAAEGPVKAAILDTAAHFQLLDGDAQTALKTQEAAIKLADETLKEQLTEFLKKIKKAIEKQSK